jgi:hypothetical protein
MAIPMQTGSRQPIRPDGGLTPATWRHLPLHVSPEDATVIPREERLSQHPSRGDPGGDRAVTPGAGNAYGICDQTVREPQTL